MFTLFLITTISVLFLALFYRKLAKLPPGHIPLPLIGNVHQLAWLVARHGGVVNAMKELKKTYGPIFTIWMGPQPTVHICSMELAHETMIKRGGEFADRWLPTIVNVVSQGRGIIQSNGPLWQEQRRFALHTLRNFGLGRGIMEERIMMELDYRCQLLNKELEAGRNEIQANDFFELTVGSIINRLLLNERFEKDKEAEFFALKHRLTEASTAIAFFDCLYDYEFLRSLPYFKERWNRITSTFEELRDYVQKPIRERIAAVERGDHVIQDDPDDYVDAFLTKMKTEDPETTAFREETLVINIFDLWLAGQETTASTLLTGFHLLLQHPEVVALARKELLEVTGRERHLSLKDKAKTPYLNALTTEIHRHASIVAINLLRKTQEDITVGGHPVPSGTPISAEVSVLMSEDEYFKDTTKFDPSRFLENDKLDQRVLPFGLGKRSCPGESLARAEVYLITGNMLLRYNIAPPTSEPLPPSKKTIGFIKATPRYKMRLTKIDR